MTALAVAPIRIPYGLKGLAQGYVAGTIVKAFVPGIMGQGTNRDINSDFA